MKGGGERRAAAAAPAAHARGARVLFFPLGVWPRTLLPPPGLKRPVPASGGAHQCPSLMDGGGGGGGAQRPAATTTVVGSSPFALRRPEKKTKNRRKKKRDRARACVFCLSLSPSLLTNFLLVLSGVPLKLKRAGASWPLVFVAHVRVFCGRRRPVGGCAARRASSAGRGEERGARLPCARVFWDRARGGLVRPCSLSRARGERGFFV